MKPRKPKELKRAPIIKELKYFESDYQGSSWFLFHYGKTYFNSNKNRLYRECYFKSIDEKSPYYIKGWDKSSDMKKIDIPETSVYYYPLGSVFSSKGRYLSTISSSSGKNKGHFIKNIKLSSNGNYKSSEFKEKLQDSLYPLLEPNLESAYSDSPYYYGEKEEFGRKVEVIVPIQVITSYFFYLSPICIYNILNEDLDVGIKDPVFDVFPPVLPYRSNVIREKEVRTLGRYYFTTTRDYSIKCLKAINSRFRKAMINNKKLKGEFGNHYIKSAIPFKLNCYFDFIGFYIDERDAKRQRFIVLGVHEIRVSKKDGFFKFENFNIDDLNDKRSTANREGKDEYGYTAIKPDYSGFRNEFKGEEVNSDFKPLDKIESNGRNQFMKTPDISKLDRTDQNYKYILENLILKPVAGISDNYGNQSSGSEYQKYNEVSQISLNDFFEVTMKAMSFLEKQGADVKTIKLKDNDGVFSYAPIANQYYDRLLIFQISVQGYNYCLIDAGYGKLMGVFRYVNFDLEFKVYDDSNLTLLIIDLIEKENFNFSNIRKIQKYNGFYFLEPFRHLEKKFRNSDIEAKAKNLARRMIDKINKDV